jgi:site-specific DNA-cytosine methylase
MTAPLAIDLFCGLGGWTEGLLAEGYYVVGFDIEQHIYGDHKYPANLVLQDVQTLHGSQFRDAALIVASPPCQAYSYRAMPWKRAKALPPPDNTLFNECFRIQREACEEAGRHIPLIVENVRGAQPWVGRARWAWGSFFLWGDVPALMPAALDGTKQGGDWFAEARRGGKGGTSASYGSKSPARKFASAMIAKIPLPLARYIAATFKPPPAGFK